MAAVSYEESLYVGPVTAASTAATDADESDRSDVFFAIGNVVFVACADDTHPMRRHVVCAAEHGDAVTAILPISKAAGARSAATLLVGTAAGQLSIVVARSTAMSVEWQRARVVPLWRAPARVCAAAVSPCGKYACVVTALATAHMVQLPCDSSDEDVVVSVCCDATPGMSFAADVRFFPDERNTAGYNALVFSGTYSGDVVVWQPFAWQPIEVSGDSECRPRRCGRVVSRLPAHQPGCAMFGVRAVTLQERDVRGSLLQDAAAHILVSTCSDDRSATLFHGAITRAEEQFEVAWTPLWRGRGDAFASDRLLAVDVLVSLSEGLRRVYIATACEDGAAQLVELSGVERVVAPSLLNSSETAGSSEVTDRIVARNSAQHGGHGAYRVILLPRGVNLPRVVSFGFDGAVRSVSSDVMVTYAAPTAFGQVRGVSVDAHDNIVAVFSDRVVVARADDRVLVVPLNLFSPESGRAALPCAQYVLPCNGSSGTYDAVVVGDTRGCVHLIMYDGASLTRGRVVGACLADEAQSDGAPAVGKILAMSAVQISNTTIATVCVRMQSAPLRGCVWNISRDDGCGGLSDETIKWTMSVVSNGSLAEKPSEVMCLTLHTVLLPVLSPGEDPHVHTLILIGVGKKHGTVELHQLDLGSLNLEAVEIASTKVIAAWPGASATAGPPARAQPSGKRKDDSIQCVAFSTPSAVAPHHVEVTAYNGRGEMWRMTLIADCASPRVVSGPLGCAHRRLPWDASCVLAASSDAAVTQHGTLVHVFARSGSGSGRWNCVREIRNVRAPRLLFASVAPGQRQRAVFVHCSDGRTLESCAAPTAPAVEETVTTDANVLGKDYNCVAFIPSPVNTFMCGNEDSSITINSEPFSTRTTASPTSRSDVLCGPHSSNIHAMCAVPYRSASNPEAVYMASVGGLSTISLWTATPSPAGSWYWEPASTHCAAGNRQNAERVPRFLSVCAVTPLDSEDEDRQPQDGNASPNVVIVIGGSDGRIHLMDVRSCGGETNYAELATPQSLPVNPSHPSPLLCVATVNDGAKCRSSLVVAGDTNGFAYVAHVRREASGNFTLSALRSVWLGKAAVNAVSSGLRCYGADGNSSEWLFGCGMDSGDVRLLAVPHDSPMSDSDVCVSRAVSVGCTAARGVSWSSSCAAPSVDSPLLHVCLEGTLSTLRVRRGSGAEEERWTLKCVAARRVNVFGVSGLAVCALPPQQPRLRDASDEDSSMAPVGTEECLCIVGQGIEMIRLRSHTRHV